MPSVSRVCAGLWVAAICAIAPSARALHAVQPPPLVINRYAERQPTYTPPLMRSRPVSEWESSRKKLVAVTASLRQQFLTSAEYTSALASAKDARQAYQESTQAIVAQVRSSVAYKTKQIAVSRAEQQVDAARSKGDAERAAAAQKAIAARTALARVESDALAADPNVAAARQNCIETAAHVRELTDQFQSSINENPEWRAARAELDAARDGRFARQ